MQGRPIRRAAVVGALALGGALTGACAPTPRSGAENPTADQGHVITRDDIARFGVTNAWEAVQRGASHLVMRENSRGGVDRITYRGVTSLMLSPNVLFVVDGTVLSDHTPLRDIRAETVMYIQLLSGVEGTWRYGSGGGNGVVFVATSVPLE